VVQLNPAYCNQRKHSRSVSMTKKKSLEGSLTRNLTKYLQTNKFEPKPTQDSEYMVIFNSMLKQGWGAWHSIDWKGGNKGCLSFSKKCSKAIFENTFVI